jgi:hypothetical protein
VSEHHHERAVQMVDRVLDAREDEVVEEWEARKRN